jgi:predicted lipoprotein
MILCGLLPAKAERKTHAEMVHAAIDTHILPRLERLATATSHLEAAVASICSGAKGGRIGADAAFKETVLAWGAIDFVRFGPIAEGHRLERFFFWPDPRGITARQLSATLAKRNEALLAPGALATQSAAIQGLSALEMLLYDQAHPLDAAGDDARYRCAYASAIAANLRTIAHEVSEAWQGPEGWHMKMEAPGSDNPLYKDSSETAREVVKTILTGLQIVQDRHIMPRLNAAAKVPPKPPRLAFERSQLTADYIGAEIASLKALYEATGIAAYAPSDKLWMAAFLGRSFDELAADNKKLAKIDPKATPVAEETLTLMRHMRFTLNGLRQIINRELAPAADLTLGFNELDGD